MSKSSTVTVREAPVAEVTTVSAAGLTIHGETFVIETDERIELVDLTERIMELVRGMSIREGIKAFSEWPTIPQLYVKGEFVGGCDIVREMFQAGELQEMLADKGIKHTAVA